MKGERVETFSHRRVIEQKDGEDIASYLRRLESAGLYVFHGSPEKIEKLEPRDPITDATDNLENKRLAVYAYSSAALSVQRAIIDRKKAEGDWSIVGGTDPENLNTPLLMTTPNIRLAEGYVHVLPKSLFRHTGGEQWISESFVTPVTTVKVSPEVYTSLGGLHKNV